MNDVFLDCLLFSDLEKKISKHLCNPVDSPWPWYTPIGSELYIKTLWHYAQGRRFILELGTGPEGLSGVVFSYLTHLMEGHTWSVDIVDFGKRSNELITYILKDTLELEWNRYIDLLYIDAEHTADRVRQELRKYSPYVWRGGLILMDDLRHDIEPNNGRPTQIEMVVDEFCEEFKLSWEYCAPLPNKIGVIHVDRPIVVNPKVYIDWNDVKPQKVQA